MFGHSCYLFYMFANCLKLVFFSVFAFFIFVKTRHSEKHVFLEHVFGSALPTIVSFVVSSNNQSGFACFLQKCFAKKHLLCPEVT
jgi:hypothetical protein